jgi:hypothetical protein
MQLRRVRVTHFALTLALSTALACAAFGAAAGSAMAGGVPSRDSYSVNISPGSVQKGSSTTFDVAIANTSTPGRTIGAAAITPPLGFRVTGASLPSGAKGHVYVLFNVVLLDRLSVAPGSTLHVAVTATAPSRCNTPFTRWFTVATGGLFGELMWPDPSSSLTTSVTCDVATGLNFASQPTDALVGSTITNSPYNTSGNGVTVDLVDSGGNTVNTTGTPVTIALASNPGNATLSGTLTQNTVNGVATFNDLKLNEPDNGYTLTATSSGVTSASSSSFDENDQETACTAGTDCSDTITSGSGSLGVDIPDPASNSTITESVDVGTPMDGPGANPKDVGCARYSPPPGSADWYEFVENPGANANGGQTFDAKTITWTVNNAENGDNNFEVCFGAPYDFQIGFNDDGAPILAPQGPLPDGTTGFVGLLDTCSDLDDAASSNPCVSNQESVGDTGIQVTIAIPAGLQGDPWAAR